MTFLIQKYQKSRTQAESSTQKNATTMMDGDGDVDMLQEPSITKCFSLIQNRKLPPPSTASICSLCPSMDLIVICRGDTLWIHRTVSWQRLATFQQDDVNISSVCWAPDGKSLAVAFSDGTIALQHVETLSSEEDNGEVQTLPLPNVESLTWAHVGKPHASWILSETELERQVTWKYQSRYLDRASIFLPPTSYLVQEDEAVGAAIMTHPSSQTPLSLLCATTRNEKMHLYLHGRYDIATLASLTPVKSVCCTVRFIQITHSSRCFLSIDTLSLASIGRLPISSTSHFVTLLFHDVSFTSYSTVHPGNHCLLEVVTQTIGYQIRRLDKITKKL